MYDLVVTGGTVVDPDQHLNEPMDVAITSGRISAIEPNLDANQASRQIDATGMIVCPGLVDLHVHVYEGVSHYGINADEHVLRSGVTTAVDAGSAGASTFSGLRRYVMDVSDTRLLAFLNVSAMGMISAAVGELEEIRWADPAAAIEVCEANRDVILGIKVRLTGNIAGPNAAQALRNARAAADATGLPLMVHPNDPQDFSLDEVLAELKAGDLVTHCFHGMPGGVLNDDGHVRDCVKRAIDAGVLLDVGHGKGSFDFDVAERAVADGVIPHTISTDLHVYNVHGPVFDLATTVSKFLLLGLDLPDAIARCTAAPADVIGMSGQIGTLAPGAHGDLAIFELEEAPYTFVDVHGKTRLGDRRLVPAKVVRAGMEIPAVARG